MKLCHYYIICSGIVKSSCPSSGTIAENSQFSDRLPTGKRVKYLAHESNIFEGGSHMRSVDSWLDRFAYRHPKFGIPNLMYLIIAGTVAVFLLDQFSGGTFSALLDFYPAAILHGQIWRLVTFIFMPPSSL